MLGKRKLKITMKCPIDKIELNKQIYEGDVEIERCPQCKGVWLDAGELEEILETIENDYTEELKSIPDSVGRAYEMARSKLESERKCHNCGKSMEKREYGYCSQIMIDVCPSCRGIWLDNGEIQALEVFFERTRAEGIRKGFFGSLLSLFD